MTTLALPPIVTAAPAGCPPWCSGGCAKSRDEDGSTYHGSAFVTLMANSVDRGETQLNISATQLDAVDASGVAEVHLLVGDAYGEDLALTPARARELAAMLLNGADAADPLPLGEMSMPAEQLRLTDRILTADGWQTVRGLLMFADADQVKAYTDERDDENSAGWGFTLAESVSVRRQAVLCATIASRSDEPGEGTATWTPALDQPDEPTPQAGRRPRMTYLPWRKSQLVMLGATAVDEHYWQCPRTGCKVWAGPYGDPITAKRAGFDHVNRVHR